ncbi:MAG: UbiA family prenyltransferase [Verrucomicrobiaceae bacterium]|nr:UbiA family prenyltransferase [Verrucomicrobiaceae bacterium]
MKGSGVNVYLKIARVSNLPTVWANCIAGWLLGGGAEGLSSLGELTGLVSLVVLIFGASFVYSAGMVMNDAVDVGFDREHRPDRPLPSGEISLNMAWGLAIALLGGGVVLMVLASASPALSLLLAGMIIGYNVFHRRWEGSVWLMGGCRTLLYLVAASVALPGGWFIEAVVIWAIALGVYTVGITLAARGEAEDKGTGKLGLSMLAAPLLAAVVIYFSRADQSGVMVMISLIAWGGWSAFAVLLLLGQEEGRVSRSVAYLIAGMMLIDAMAISFSYPWMSMVLMGMLPVVLLLQRRISAT